jgi:nucleoside-diphosphate-sugar epimerase
VILVTGAEGLIGRHLCARLEAAKIAYRKFDVKLAAAQDIRDSSALADALKGVRGVVHLAAVSRVVWGERNPSLCVATNLSALGELLKLCLEGERPWFIFASSREVYGTADHLPVHEDAPLRPLNTYGRTKQQGEVITRIAGEYGLLANICRFSNVYGCPFDHPDRVVPAFAHAAAHGGQIRIEGSANTFDFTEVHDVIDGLLQLIEATRAGERLPPVHFVSGQGTTLSALAEIATMHALKKVSVTEAPPRSFDVSRFIGDPSRARSLLGWTAKADLRSEFLKLVAALGSLDQARSAGGV